MKNINLLAVFAATLTLFSCNRSLEIEQPVPSPADEPVTRLTVSLEGVLSAETRAGSQSMDSENAIKSCQVFVFRTDSGVLDASAYAGSLSVTDEYAMELSCTAGERKVYALVNAPQDYTLTVKDEASLKAINTDLKDNSVGSLVMIGNATKTLPEGACNVPVSVSRIAASILLSKVTLDMDASAYQGAGLFKVKKVYLINVCGRTNLGLTTKASSVSPDFWYGKLQGETDSSKKALIFDEFDTPVSIENGAEYTLSRVYYAYPNDCAHSISGTFSQRATLLVVEATLDGKTYYYPLMLDALQSNKRYVISNLTIHRPGSATPYEPVLFSTASAAISVVPWGEGCVSTVEI